jgi:sigma-B regulation protein RsbU (phosphoserine phosphatase)
VLGLLALGPRLSDEPYSSEDERLLKLVADQAALAIENLPLAAEIADRIKAERRQARELAIAQDVQQQPRSSPRRWAQT